MGAIFFIGLNGLLIWGLFVFFKSKPERNKFYAEVKQKPFSHIFILIWIIGIMAFGWGVLSNEDLSILINTPLGEIESWQLGGIVALVGFIAYFFFDFD